MDKQRISASDINKYTHCPYQWYYEKIYSTKALRQMRSEMLCELGLTDARKSAFVKGTKFHSRHFRTVIIKKVMVVIVILILVLLLIYGVVIWSKFI